MSGIGNDADHRQAATAFRQRSRYSPGAGRTRWWIGPDSDRRPRVGPRSRVVSTRSPASQRKQSQSDKAQPALCAGITHATAGECPCTGPGSGDWSVRGPRGNGYGFTRNTSHHRVRSRAASQSRQPRPLSVNSATYSGTGTPPDSGEPSNCERRIGWRTHITKPQRASVSTMASCRCRTTWRRQTWRKPSRTAWWEG